MARGSLVQDVLGLDVTVDHAMRVRLTQGICHFSADLERIVHGQLLLAVPPIAERGGEFVVEHHDRDVLKVPEIVRKVDRGHATRPEPAVDAIAASQGSGVVKWNGAGLSALMHSIATET